MLEKLKLQDQLNTRVLLYYEDSSFAQKGSDISKKYDLITFVCNRFGPSRSHLKLSLFGAWGDLGAMHLSQSRWS